MKQLCFLILIVCLHFTNAQGQVNSDYNRRGDAALEKGDYFGAQSFYDQGLVSCDFYSISKMTEIWNLQPTIRRTMNGIINKCFNCLNTLAEAKDTRAMQLLIDYYNQGIGIEKDSIKANYWRTEVGKIFGISDLVTVSTSKIDTVYVPGNNPNEIIPNNTKTQSSIIKLLDEYNVFIAYTFSPTMPIGFTIGSYNKLGFSINIKSSLKHPDERYECNKDGVINYSGSYEFNKYKWNSLMATASMLIPVFSDNFCFSIGSGFGRRDLYRQITEYDATTAKQKGTAWCYDVDRSYKGAVVEIGALYRYKGVLILGGVNSISFKDFDGYVGLGYSF